MGMVIAMVPRPHVLRHAGDHAQQKPECAIEPMGAKQAAMAAFMHQRKHAQREQADQQHRGDGEPVGNGDTQYSSPPEDRKGRQRRQNLRQSFNIIGLNMPTNDGPLLFLYSAHRRHHRAPLFRVMICVDSRREKSNRSNYQSGRLPVTVPASSSRMGTNCVLEARLERSYLQFREGGWRRSWSTRI